MVHFYVHFKSYHKNLAFFTTIKVNLQILCITHRHESILYLNTEFGAHSCWFLVVIMFPWQRLSFCTL